MLRAEPDDGPTTEVVLSQRIGSSTCQASSQLYHHILTDHSVLPTFSLRNNCMDNGTALISHKTCRSRYLRCRFAFFVDVSYASCGPMHSSCLCIAYFQDLFSDPQVLILRYVLKRRAAVDDTIETARCLRLVACMCVLPSIGASTPKWMM